MAARPQCAKMLACLLSFAIAGCHTGPRQVETVTRRSADVVAVQPNCPVIARSDRAPAVAFLIPLAVAAAPVVAQVIVDGSIKLLEKQRSDRNFTATAQGGGKLVKKGEDGVLGLESGCLVVFRGVLGPWDPKEKRPNNGRLTRANLERLGLAGYPDFYYEAWLTGESNDPKKEITVTIDTKLVHFAETGARSEGSGKKSIGLMLVFSKSVAKDETEKGLAASNAVAPMLFKDVEIGTEISSNDKNDDNLFQDQRVSLTLKETDGGVLNLYAVVNESEEPRFFEELALKAVMDNKDNLTKALTKTLTDAINQAKPDSAEKK